jgi:Uma2 family endonuclease
MAVETTVSVEEYLHTSYRPDCDYVDGEVQERNVGEKDHGRTQGRIYRYLCNLHPELDERLIPEQRVQVKPTRFRVPDLCLLAEDAPDEQVVSYPPILCIEILSPEDRLSRYLERLNDYFQMGVPVCWVIDPTTRQAWVATPGQLTEASDGILRFEEFELPLDQVLK